MHIGRDRRHKRFARRLLLCVAVVSRPLRVEELAECLAFDFNAGPIPKYREDWRLEDPVEAVLSTCSTLLALVSADGSQVIRILHYLVKEFLTSSRFAGFPPALIIFAFQSQSGLFSPHRTPSNGARNADHS